MASTSLGFLWQAGFRKEAELVQLDWQLDIVLKKHTNAFESAEHDHKRSVIWVHMHVCIVLPAVCVCV